MMGNILSAEFFKLRKERVTKIVFVINLLLAVGLSLMMALMAYHFGEDILGVVQEAEQGMMLGADVEAMFAAEAVNAPATALMLFFQHIAVLVTILAGVFICGEFDTGTIRNTLAVGKCRVKYYLAKVITAFIAAMIMAIIATAIYAAVFAAYFGLEVPEGYAVSLLWLFGANVLIYLTYTSLFVMLAFVFRSMVATLVVSIAFVTLAEAMLLMLLDASFMERFAFISNIFPYHNLMVFVNSFSEGHDMQAWLTAAAICALTVVVTTVIGAFTFAKRDVK